mmetsp:Transcript_106122/g.300075  ORF Transcript_106122/g.300075 Transcript_106122/m.300075 type:complete len:352 (+) Transcript_106122:69-1124(+)
MEAAAAPAHESRLFETVRLIREWVEGSFEPVQEQRFQSVGRFKARFDVDLGSQMCEQLKAYMKASFALSRLQLHLASREQPGKPPRPCVEVLMTEAARDLYAQKHPDAVARRRGQLPALPDEGAAGGPAASADPAALEGAKQASLADRPPLALTAEAPRKQPIGQALACKLPEGKAGAGQQAAGQGRRGRCGASTGADSTAIVAASAAEPAPAKRALAGAPVDPAGKRAARASGGPAPPASVWESVAPHEVPSGIEGLLEAKDALDVGMRAGQGLSALKAEKEAVGWLKGLANRGVGPVELRETLIGQSVNAWRKHSEPYVASLALSLMRAWKAAWREAESDAKKRTSCVA